MPTKSKSRSKFAQVRHPFLYKLYKGDGTFSVHKAWAKVVHAKKPIDLVLTVAHVRKSIKLNGAGDTSKCSMAICAYDHADKFPVPVEGHIDWNYARAFPVTNLDKQGLPCKCLAYEHNRPDIARLNDSGKTGQQQLLRLLERKGPITVRLLPIRYRSEEGRSGRNRKGTGVRDPMKRKGAHLRYAVYKLGAQPQD
jgi:hypothetical protein